MGECLAENDPCLIAETIIEASPSIAIRVTGKAGAWKTEFITKNVSQLGYTREDFMSGKMRWQDIVHPEDAAVLNREIVDHDARGEDKYIQVYRVVKANGEPMWVTDHSTIVRDADGKVRYSDCIITDYSETRRHIDQIEDYYRQQRVFKEILLGLHDADPEKAVQIILDSTGVYLDISRVLLFKDNADNTECTSIYEWLNSGVPGLGDLTLNYRRDIPEIYEDLHGQGYQLVSHGDIPTHSREEFEKEGVIASAIFAVHVDDEFFGFICFDECVKHRVWPDDTVRFLHNISKLVGPAIIRRRNAQTIARPREN